MNDEAVRRLIMARQQAAPARHMAALERAECLRLLTAVPLGWVVFTKGALPAIRPVNHVVVDGAIIIRTHDGAALTAVATGPDAPCPVVAYEADAIDPDTRLGWSVVATDYAQLVTDPAEVQRYEQLVTPWVDAAMHYVVRISPELVTGFCLIAQPE
ncbi:pyridoxamine 5'-phosphate oxidase family protein [Kitasatospora sp. NPDC101155]|uniref:pyridoxamine 5'-phosphate oxidase family protein n=1 Tax=Kitasatospora sp. NPDC101155 TaxID=3364097 RepID=UPI0037FE5089